MKRFDEARIIPVDFEDYQSGFLSPRDAAQLDREQRREQVEFDRLCITLSKRAYAQRLEENEPEKRAAARKQWIAQHRELHLSQNRIRLRRKRRGIPAPVFANVCAGCGALWESKRPARYCHPRCRRRHLNILRGKPPTAREKVWRFLQRHPGAMSREIGRRCHIKSAALFRVLRLMRQDGQLLRTDDEPPRYWVGVPGSATGCGEWTLRSAHRPVISV